MKRLLASMWLALLPATAALADENDLLEAPVAEAQAPAPAAVVANPPAVAAPEPAVAAAPAPVAPESPAAARLVGVILSTSQALVWDSERGEYALKRMGEMLDGGRIVALQADRLVLERNGARVDVEIGSAPFKPPVRHARRMPAVIIGALGAPAPAPVVVAAAPVAPAPAAVVVAPAAVAVAPAPVAVAPAPVAVAPAPVVVAPAPVVVAPAPVVVAPAPTAPAPRLTIAVQPAPPAPAAQPASDDEEVEATVIPRTDLDRELGDFGSLSMQAAVQPGPRGGFRLAAVRPGSFVSRVGLRAGDIILRVDSRAINRLEDAAAAYAWLRVTDHFSVDIVRDGQAVRLHYVIAPTAARATR